MAMNGTSPELLSGWKDIARYLGKGVRTVQRYERDMGLPVRRPAGKVRGSVLATKSELDAWVSVRPIRKEFQLAQALPKTSETASSDFRIGLANMRRLQRAMLELSAELRHSVQKLETSLLLIGGLRGEERIRRAMRAVPVEISAFSAKRIESIPRLREEQSAARVPPRRT